MCQVAIGKLFLSGTDRSNGYLSYTKNLRSPTKGLTKPPTLCYAASGIWQSLFTVNFINRMIGSGETETKNGAEGTCKNSQAKGPDQDDAL